MHFCAASLPAAVAAVQAKLPPGTKFLVYPPAFIRGFLTLLGVPAEDILIFDPTKVYHAHQLFVAEGFNEVADVPACETAEVVQKAVLAALPLPGLSAAAPRLS